MGPWASVVLYRQEMKMALQGFHCKTGLYQTGKSGNKASGDVLLSYLGQSSSLLSPWQFWAWITQQADPCSNIWNGAPTSGWCGAAQRPLVSLKPWAGCPGVTKLCSGKLVGSTPKQKVLLNYLGLYQMPVT